MLVLCTAGHVHKVSLAFTLALLLNMKFKQDSNSEILIGLRMDLQFFSDEYVCRASSLPGSEVRSKERKGLRRSKKKGLSIFFEVSPKAI